MVGRESVYLWVKMAQLRSAHKKGWVFASSNHSNLSITKRKKCQTPNIIYSIVQLIRFGNSNYKLQDTLKRTNGKELSSLHSPIQILFVKHIYESHPS